MDSLIAVVGTLFGIALGAGATYLNQRLGYQREFEERLATTRRQIYVQFMSAVHDMFVQVDNVYRQHRDGALTDREASSALRVVAPRDAQAALEHVRLVASDLVASAAAEIWTHMRREGVATGRSVDRRAFVNWRVSYWEVRRALIDAARTDLGFAPRDWETAGVGTARPDRSSTPGLERE
jgi:hypothetical protein